MAELTNQQQYVNGLAKPIEESYYNSMALGALVNVSTGYIVDTE
jgi:hypothetical protein